MAVPKRKTSKRRKGNRRAHHALGTPELRPCPDCKAMGISHRICPECGKYKGRLIIAPKVKKAKEEKEAS